MRKFLAVLAVLVAHLVTVPIVAPTPAVAITGTYEKDFAHDYVGLLVFYTTPDAQTGDTFSHRCSGTLISPTIVVTAGHCTAGVDEGRAYFQQAAAPNYDPNAFGGLGGDLTTGYPYLNGITFGRADNYNYPETGDLGVVVLDTPYTPPSGLFGVLPEVGAIDAYVASNAKKQDIRFVTSGYGVTDLDPRPVSFRERLMSWLTLSRAGAVSPPTT